MDTDYFDIRQDDRKLFNEDWKNVILKSLYYLKGLEERIKILNNELKENNEKREIVNELLEELVDTGLNETQKLNLLNRIMIVLGLKGFSKEFFNIVFGDVNFRNTDAIKEKVHKFRCLCLLKYGRFRGGYREFLKNPEELRQAFKEYFPDDDTVSDRKAKYSGLRKIVGFKDIPPEHRFCLGYLATREFPDVRDSRSRLKEILEKATQMGVKDYRELVEKVGIKKGELEELIAKASIPNAKEKIIYHRIHYPDTPYVSLLNEVIQHCEIGGDTGMVEIIRRKGKENTYAYLSCEEIDIYFATSMRKREDFEFNYRFIQSLMKHRSLKDLKILYFDPTQSYVDDRIQKGLIECIMLQRAKITVYNAQETETFGKVAEATLTLAYGKPVIIYIPRILATSDDYVIKKIYEHLDHSIFYDHVRFLEVLRDDKLLTDDEFEEYKVPEREKIDVINILAQKFVERLSGTSEDNILRELHDIGFHVSDSEDLFAFVKNKFIELEKMALVFRDLHPLAFQISPLDNVARGVFVARTITQVAKLIEGILVSGISYEIKKLGDNVVLFDEITMSPIRVAPRDEAIGIAIPIKKVHQ